MPRHIHRKELILLIVDASYVAHCTGIAGNQQSQLYMPLLILATDRCCSQGGLAFQAQLVLSFCF